MNNCLSQPEFTINQIGICQSCKHISGKKIWCCKWGVYVREKGRPLQNKIQKREPKIITPPTVPQMITHFTKAMARWAVKGFKCIPKEEYVKRRMACYQCTPSGRCPHCGCMLWAKAALTTEKCPENKW